MGASLRDYAVPNLGAMPVSDVETADVLAILTPIWNSKPETARRVRQTDLCDHAIGLWPRAIPG